MDEELSLVDRLVAVMGDKMTIKLDALEKSVDAMIEVALQRKKAEIEGILHKAIGPGDPTIHMSELPGYFRKYLLEHMETDKRTPGPINKAGPEGTVGESPIDKLLEEFNVKPEGKRNGNT